MEKRFHKPRQLLCQSSLFVYLIWILLPTLQEALHSYPGILSVLLLGAGMISDTQWLKKNALRLALSCIFTVLLAAAGAFVLAHDGCNPRSFMVSRCLYFYPVIFASYCLSGSDFRLDKRFHILILLCVGITAAITVGWNIEGLIHRSKNGSARCYSRLIGDERIDLTLRTQYKLRGIGSLSFIYAQLFLLPLLFARIESGRGWKRAGYIAFLLLNVLCIALSQYTYAIVFMALVLMAELLSLLICRLSRGKIRRGIAMALSFLPLILALLLADPLVKGLYDFVNAHNLSFMKASIQPLYELTRGGIPGIVQNLAATFREVAQNPPSLVDADGNWQDPGRLALYFMSLAGFVKSPLIGSLFGGNAINGYHSDLLDSLSGCGLLGTAALSAMVLWILAPLRKPVKESPCRAHFGLAGVLALLLMLLTTYLGCREISAVFFTELVLLCTWEKKD